MSLYVLVMRRGDDLPDEIRFHDRPLTVSSRVSVGGRDWVVTAVEDTKGTLRDPSGAEVTARYICARADRLSGGLSGDLIGSR
jgi:hypothetical protein